MARTLADDQGGHFYNCEYGVRVKGGDDTLVVWNPSHWHGTSLQDYPPTTENISQFNQIGLAIITPNRVPRLWKKVMDGKMTFKELEMLDSDGEDSDDEDSDGASDGGDGEAE